MSGFDLSDLIGSHEAVVGVDVGGTKTHAVLFSDQGPIASARRRTRTTGPSGIMKTLEDVLGEVAQQRETTGLRLVGIGIGIPGIVSTGQGTVSHGVNVGLPGADFPLAALAAEHFATPVFLTNDVTAATLGSARLMGVGGDVALISIGTGLATGMILDGLPRYGALGSAGEIGHIPYIADGLPCPCGQQGCLELFASGNALGRMWPARDGLKPAESLLAAASTGDETARDVLSVWMGAIAHTVTTVGLTLDIATILIGGGIAEIGAPFLAALRAELERRASGSQFLTHMDLTSRVALVPPGLEVAPLGAALAAIGEAS
ncbi:ROK family protein [Actinomycetaceae bacterium L2_0104]